MEKERYFWIFDRSLFEQIKLPEFSLFEGLLIVLSLGALALYLLLIIYLDTRSRLVARRGKQRAWLERWLVNADLSPVEAATLERLAREPGPMALYRLLSDPVTFETRIHEDIEAGRPVGLEFLLSIREKLRAHSPTLRVPIVSTRQFQPDDPVRLMVWRGGLPQHYYGKVGTSGLRSFTVLPGPEAIKVFKGEPGPVGLFYLRGPGLEYPFSCTPVRGAGGAENRIEFLHELVVGHRSPRRTRLPVLREITFRHRAYDKDAVSDLDPDDAALPARKGLLLDLSAGGFSLSHGLEIPVGHYVEFSLPLGGRRGRLPLVGRVKECRPFSGNQWLSRCEVRGLTKLQLAQLAGMVRQQEQARMRALAPVFRRAAKAG